MYAFPRWSVGTRNALAWEREMHSHAGAWERESVGMHSHAGAWERESVGMHSHAGAWERDMLSRGNEKIKQGRAQVTVVTQTAPVVCLLP